MSKGKKAEITEEATEELIPQVTLSRRAVEKLVKLAEDLEHADNAYKNCQATIYRSYVQGLYKAANTRNAVAEAKEALGE